MREGIPHRLTRELALASDPDPGHRLSSRRGEGVDRVFGARD